MSSSPSLSSYPSSSAPSLSPYSSTFLGSLSLVSGRPHLRMGNYLCEGKLVKLNKPLVIAKKTKLLTEQDKKLLGGEGEINKLPPSHSYLHCVGVIRRKFVFVTRPKAVLGGGGGGGAKGQNA